jgi:response regulator RpfG family c-di-GMP phosphodiesterase
VHKLLIVDDDEAMRRLLKLRLSTSYEVIETGQPEQAMELALVHKPDAILMDLMMPQFSGFELCQSIHTLSYTARIPIFVVSGESVEKYKEHCQHLGALDFFQKPVDFKRLQDRLAEELDKKRAERRSAVRVRMKVILKLRGTDARGQTFEEMTSTENVSVNGFLCQCIATLTKNTIVEVFLSGKIEKYVGRAVVVRQEAPGTPWQKYGFQFQERTTEWVLQPS